MSNISINIPQEELRRFQSWLNRYSSRTGDRVKQGMQSARLKMESTAKLTVTDAGLVDTGRLRSSLVPSIINNGYGVKMFIDLTGKEAPRVGQKSGTPKGAVAVANYAAKFEPRVKFMEKSLDAAKAKFLEVMSR